MSKTQFVMLLVAFVAGMGSGRAWGDSFGSGANAFSISFVTIGNPGNAADTTGSPKPAGSVPYTFRIGTYEISEQMIDKANALGGLGITKDARGPDKPATSVSWNEAARFVNWLDTSTGSPPAYKFAIQPGETGYSANDNIQLWKSSDPGYDPNNLFRNTLARYFLPSAQEWYKAAFYDPTSGVYYDFPTGSYEWPTATTSGTVPNTAVFEGSATSPADVTLAGGLSPYGTMAQGGNVDEWQESSIDLRNDDPSYSRMERGGCWDSSYNIMLSDDRGFRDPYTENIAVGFRVGSVPEPNALLLAVFAGVGLLLRRRGIRQPAMPSR